MTTFPRGSYYFFTHKNEIINTDLENPVRKQVPSREAESKSPA